MALYNAGLISVLFISFFMMLLVSGRKSMPGAIPMLHLLSGMCLWCICQLMHIYVVDPHIKYFWYQAKYAGIIMVAPSFVIIAAEMTGFQDRIRIGHKKAILAIMILTLAAVMSDPWIHLFRKEIDYVIMGSFVLIKSQDGPAFWAFTMYTYALILISLALLIRKVGITEGRERKQMLLMLAGCALPWMGNSIFLLSPGQPGVLDYTPVLMLVTEVIFLFSLFYYRMFNIIPYTKRAVFDSLEDLIVVVDTEGLIQDMNPAARGIFRSEASRISGRFTEFMKCLTPPYNGFVGDISGEFQAERQGSTRDYQSIVTAVFSSQGNCIGYLLVFNDITETSDSRRVLETAARALDTENEKKMLFVKQVNRNIRMPLNRVLGFAEAFSAKTLSETQAEAIEHLQISGGHLIQLINDITDYSKIEAGEMKLVEEPVQLFDLVRHVCRLYEYPAEQKGVRVTYSIASDVPVTLLVDSLRLTQVLSNVVGNAVKFTEKGTVSLTVRRVAEQWMEIAVRDTGIGIPESDIKNIFIPYQQVEESKSLKFGGTGLGLAIVKDLVERMGGEIQVESVIGEGTAFVLRLPCRESRGKSPVYDLERIAEYKNKDLQVGLVTRDGVQQVLIKRFFRSWPRVVCHDIPEPETGVDRTIAWDLLLINLEEFKGADIKRILQGPAMIGMTNDADIMEKEQQGRGELDGCILMPLSFEALNRAIRKTILAHE